MSLYQTVHRSYSLYQFKLEVFNVESGREEPSQMYIFHFIFPISRSFVDTEAAPEANLSYIRRKQFQNWVNYAAAVAFYRGDSIQDSD